MGLALLFFLLCFFSTDTLEEGPSQAELLEQLQNCDIRAGSRVSSAVSSRAPSPSPSLMSIMFPGMKQHGSQPGTPVNGTPLLASRGGSNVFQPIVFHRSVSTADSSQSLYNSATAVTSPAVVLHTAEDTERQAHIQDTGSQVEEVGKGSSATSSDAVVETPTAEGADATEGAEVKDKAGSSESLQDLQSESLHQRSRSNEIDYGTSGLVKNSSTAFRSPPGSMSKASRTGFRPVSVDSTQSSLYAGLSDWTLNNSRPTSGAPKSPEPVEFASMKAGSDNSPSSSRSSRHSTEGRSPPPPRCKESNGSILEYFDDDNDEVTDC